MNDETTTNDPWLPSNIEQMETLVQLLRHKTHMWAIDVVWSPENADEVTIDFERHNPWFVAQELMNVVLNWAIGNKRRQRRVPYLVGNTIHVPMTIEETKWMREERKPTVAHVIVFGPFEGDLPW